MDDRDGPREPLPPPPPGAGPPRVVRVVTNEDTAPVTATVVPPAAYAPRFGSLDTYFAGRLAAFIIDVFVMAFLAATFFFNLVFSHLTSTNTAPLLAFGISLVAVKNAFQGSFIVLAFGSFVCAFGFIWICETIFGTTIGKLLFGLAIRRAIGGRAGPVRVFFRNLFRPLDAIVIGGFLALVTPKHQRIGDFAGGTVVVRSPLGPVASLIAACALIALGYAQIMYGGGIGSAAGVIAQSAIAVPHVLSKLGGAAAQPATRPSSAADAQTPTPVAVPTDQPAPPAAVAPAQPAAPQEATTP